VLGEVTALVAGIVATRRAAVRASRAR
jgi:hypothetical protein